MKHYNNDHPNGPPTRVIVPKERELGRGYSTISQLEQALPGEIPSITNDIGEREYDDQALLDSMQPRLEALLAKSPEEQQAIMERSMLWTKTRIRKRISWPEIRERTNLRRTEVIILEMGLLPAEPEYAEEVVRRMNKLLGIVSPD